MAAKAAWDQEAAEAPATLFAADRRGYLNSMSKQQPSRRHLLAGLAASVVALPNAARAFSVEPLDGNAEQLYRSACLARHPAYHDELVNEMVMLLDGEGIETTPGAVRQALSAVSCPFCGCNLAQGPDDRPGEAPGWWPGGDAALPKS